MRSRIIIQLPKPTTGKLNVSQLPDFCSWQLHYAKPRLIRLPQGQILRQSHSNFLVHIELFEYQFSEDVMIDYKRKKRSVYMLFMLEGHAALYQPQERSISKNQEGTMHMGYINKGNYTLSIKAGKTSILLLTIRAEWLKRTVKRLAKLKPLLSNLKSHRQSIYLLPECAIEKVLYEQVLELMVHDGHDQNQLEITIKTVLTALIGKYHQMLDAGFYTNNAYRLYKANAIANFVLEHYSEKTVIDVPKLADLFDVSERTLRRLLTNVWPRPLHQQVIYYRLNYGLKLLMTTNDPIEQIAINVGYMDVKYFSKAFKKLFNISPNTIQTYWHYKK